MPASTEAPKNHAPGNILVIDDDPEITGLLTQVLGAAGYRVQASTDPAEALSRDLPFKPDLLIVDVLMPKISGLDVVRALKGAKESEGIRLMILSALKSEEDIERGMEAGADEYLVKPFDVPDLLRRVRRLLGDGEGTSPSRLQARRLPGRGVRLGGERKPAAEPRQVAPEQAEPVVPSGGPRVADLKGKILSVDDDPDILELVTACLKSKGYTVFNADSGEEGLLIAEREDPDLIITDLMMEGMNGYELCQKLSENPYTASIPIMLLTSKDSTEEMERALTRFADEFVSKPFNPSELTARVGALLRRTAEQKRTKRRQLQLLERLVEKALRWGYMVYSPHLPKMSRFPGAWVGPLPDLITQKGRTTRVYLVEDAASIHDERAIDRWRLLEQQEGLDIYVVGQSRETAVVAKRIKAENGFKARIQWTTVRESSTGKPPLIIPFKYALYAGLLLLGILIWMILTGTIPSIWSESGGVNRALKKEYERYLPRDVERQIDRLNKETDQLKKKISPQGGGPGSQPRF